MKHFSFGRIWGSLKMLLFKPSSSDPNAPNSNYRSKMNFINFLRRTVFSAHFWMTAAAHLRVCLLLQSTAFQLCEYLYPIPHDMGSNQWNVIGKPMLIKTKGPHAYWHSQSACAFPRARYLPIKYIIAKYDLARFKHAWCCLIWMFR